MPTRDRTGDPIDPTDTDDPADPRATIRQLLCTPNCDHDQHPTQPTLLDP